MSGARILLAEDDFMLLIDLEDSLQEAGAETTSCRNLDEAMAVANENNIDAAVLDVQLGRQLVTPLAKKLAARSIPFFFYTGQTESDPILSAWPDHKVMSKPASPKALVAAVIELLSQRPNKNPRCQSSPSVSTR